MRYKIKVVLVKVKTLQFFETKYVLQNLHKMQTSKKN